MLKIAAELVKVAKLLEAFWDLKVVAPSATDVKAAKDKVVDFLKGEGMNVEKLEFQRFMSYQENKDCHGPDCKRNSNKHLCVFGFSDKDGKFGGGVAGGRIGEANSGRIKLYQPWGIVGTGAEGERKLKQLVDAYVRRKTTQADAYQEVKLASARQSANNTLSDEDQAKFEKERDWFVSEMKKRGFDDNDRISPRWSKEQKDKQGSYTIDVGNISFPSSTMVSNDKWFRVTVATTEGKGRGGVLLDREFFKTKNINDVHKMLSDALAMVDSLLD